jgi:septal ring factor EnvC (AmiA/AmiB activator)
MSDASNAAKNLRDRLSVSTEDRLGKALGELLESPLLTGAIGRAFDAREKAAQAQEVALGALNLPSAADIERLTRRLRSVSHRLEGIEDGVGRLDRALSPTAAERYEMGQRLTSIEAQLAKLTERLDRLGGPARAGVPAASAGAKPKRAAKPAAKRKRSA